MDPFLSSSFPSPNKQWWLGTEILTRMIKGDGIWEMWPE